MTDRKETVLTDAAGRNLTIRGMTLVEQYKLAKAVGADTARNDVAWSMAQTAASVRDIDGVPLRYPTTDAEVQENIARVGDEGYAAFIAFLKAETETMLAAAKAAAEAGEKADPLPLSA
jgi:hypothetical protein